MITAVGAIAVAALVAMLTYVLDKRKAAHERLAASKMEHYKNLVLCLKNLREGRSEHVELLWFEYSILWLHAPDSVIRAFNALLARLNSEASRELTAAAIGELLLQIRRDLGFRSSDLKASDFHGRAMS
jgi:hypothetical protein